MSDNTSTLQPKKREQWGGRLGFVLATAGSAVGLGNIMSWFHGATAPPSMVRDSSGTSVAGSTVRTVPVPPQVRQAPWLLNASSSAEGA